MFAVVVVAVVEQWMATADHDCLSVFIARPYHCTSVAPGGDVCSCTGETGPFVGRGSAGLLGATGLLLVRYRGCGSSSTCLLLGTVVEDGENVCAIVCSSKVDVRSIFLIDHVGAIPR